MKKPFSIHHLPLANSGQTLTEVLFAVAIASLVLVGLTHATTTALKNSQFAKNQSLANQFAQKGMEQTRQLRDQSPDEFWAKADLGDENTETERLSPLLIKEVTYHRLTTDKMEVTVVVKWQDSSGEHRSELVSYLTKWKD